MGYNTPYIKIGKVRKGAEMIAIADNTCDSSWDSNIDPNDPTEAPGKIHNGGANVLFCDGHVTWYTQQDVCLFDVKAWNQRKAFVPLPPGDRRSNIARMWNNDNLP
jgi:prepilin-type processing-associated H-X9-DG protein